MHTQRNQETTRHGHLGKQNPDLGLTPQRGNHPPPAAVRRTGEKTTPETWTFESPKVGHIGVSLFSVDP